MRQATLDQQQGDFTMEVQLKRTIAERTSRCPDDTELRCSVRSYDGLQELIEGQRVQLTAEQLHSEDREKRRHTFVLPAAAQALPPGYHVALLEAFAPGEEEPFSVLRQMIKRE